MRENEKLPAFLYALGTLEDKSFELYRTLSKMVRNPRISALLLYIASDSLKHAMLIKTIGGDLSTLDLNDKECEKVIGDGWKTLQNISKEIYKVKTLDQEKLPPIIDNLMRVYAFTLIQFKTLQFMAETISNLYGIDLKDIKGILELTVIDEENDTQILSELKALSSKKVESENPNSPNLRYQNPDRWHEDRAGALPF